MDVATASLSVTLPFMTPSTEVTIPEYPVNIPSGFSAESVEIVTGRVKWSGKLPISATQKFFGIETESQIDCYSDGLFEEREFFSCADGHYGTFLPVELVARYNCNDDMEMTTYPMKDGQHGTTLAFVFGEQDEQDGEVIDETFQKLHYDVDLYTSDMAKDYSQVSEALDKCIKSSADNDSFILFMSFEGEYDAEIEKNVPKLIQKVQKCKSFVGKPKIFFIQSREPLSNIRIGNEFNDTLIVWTSSSQEEKEGSAGNIISWTQYITHLKEIFQENVSSSSLLSMIEKVTAVVANDLELQHLRIQVLHKLKFDVHFTLYQDLKKARINFKWTQLTLSGPTQTGEISIVKYLTDDIETVKDKAVKMTTLIVAKDPLMKWEKASTNSLKSIVRQSVQELVSRHDESEDMDSIDVQCVSVINSNSQATFLDVAPALLHFNPVNILTLNLHEDLETEECSPHLQFLQASFRSLMSLKSLEDSTDSCNYDASYCMNPSFILLGTHRSDESVLDESILTTRNRSLSGLDHFHDVCHKICKSDSGGIEIFACDNIAKANQIRQAVSRTHIRVNIPAQWILFQVELEKKSHETKTPQIILFTKCLEIAKSLGMSKEDVTDALKFFHNLNMFLYFPESVPEIVFLQLQPLFEKLDELISFEDRKLEREGVFDKTLLGDLKNEYPYKRLFDDARFLKLMENICVLVSLAKKNYFLPSALSPTDLSKEPFTTIKKKFTKEVDPLVLTVTSTDLEEGDFFPPSLFTALVFRILKRDGFQLITGEQQYRNAIRLSCAQGFGGGLLLVESNKNWVEVYYSGNSDNCSKIREIIHEEIAAAIEQKCWCKSFVSKIQDCFHCQMETTTMDHLCRVNDKKNWLTCCKVGATSNTKLNPEQERLSKWFSLDVSSKLDQRANLGVLNKELACISSIWQEIGIALNVSDNKRTEISRLSVSDTVRLAKILDSWHENPSRDSPFTWRTIINALESGTVQKNAVANNVRSHVR